MIKFFSGQWSGAPVLNGTIGSLKDVLKACLCDGFGSKTPTSAVVAGGLATFIVSGGHTLYESAYARIAGVTVTGGTLNGDRKVVSKATNTITVDATGIPDQTATLSTPTIKVAPLGWTEQFAGTANKFAAKSSQMDSTGMCFRLDDSLTGTPRGVRVRGYESMSDIDTGIGPFPTDAVISGGYWWKKSNAADTNPRAWTLVGDEYAFYLSVGFNQVPASQYYRDCYFFGDLKAVQSGDPYACVLSGHQTDDQVVSGVATHANMNASRGAFDSNARVVARRFSGVGGSVPVVNVCAGRMFFDATSVHSGSDGYTPAYPANPGNLLLVAPVLCHEPSNAQNTRGTFPGLYHITQNLNGGFGSDEIIPGSGVYAGRDFLSVVGGEGNGSKTGSVLFDLTGPWR